MAVLADDGADHGAQLGGVPASSAAADEVPVAPAEEQQKLTLNVEKTEKAPLHVTET